MSFICIQRSPLELNFRRSRLNLMGKKLRHRFGTPLGKNGSVQLPPFGVISKRSTFDSTRHWLDELKRFDPIGDSKYTSDVHWGCMLRSSQKLVAQAFLFHKFGRSWRKSLDKPLDQNYTEILQLFGDSEDSPFSIHNLLQAGKAYGLAPGSWVGPYAVCRTWETLVRIKREENENGGLSSMMAIYVVSGDEDGERGGAPLLCVQDISRHCFEFSRGEFDWTPVLMLVPLVLGLDKVNTRRM